MYALYSRNPQDYESHVWLIYWVVKIYSWYFETNIQVSYLFGIARTRPIHPKIQINSLHFQSFKALNLIWSQKKRVSKLLKKHFKSIKFLFFFPDFSRLQGWVGQTKSGKFQIFFFEPFPKVVLFKNWLIDYLLKMIFTWLVWPFDLHQKQY